MGKTLTKAQKEWIKALRSGSYEQGKVYLHTKDEKYCCLGVACDIFKKELNLYRSSGEHTEMLYDGLSCVCPESVVKHLMLTDQSGSSVYFDQPSLACLNDEGNTFKEIADILEKGEHFI